MAEVREAVVVGVDVVEGGLHRLVLRPPPGVPARAGQWLAVATDLPHPQKPSDVLRRAWSLAAIHGEDAWELLVAVVGPGTEWLARRVVGERLAFTGPWGTKFTLPDGAHPVALVATGSGISPIGALVDAALGEGRAAALWWDHGVSELGGEVPTVLAARIEGWRAAGVTVTIGALPAADQHADGVEWWLAGDGGRLDGLAAALTERGATVHLERFFGPPGTA